MNQAHNLFLLLINLSQMHDEKSIMQLFVEGLSEMFKPMRFNFLQVHEKQMEDELEIRSRDFLYGYVRIDKNGSTAAEDKALIENAVHMLAIILERLTFEKNLQLEKNRLEKTAEQKNIELVNTVQELEKARKASLNLIEDLNLEIEKRRKYEDELRKLKNKLQEEVEQKTKELQVRIAELERFRDATVEREFRMKELRDEIDKLKNKNNV